MLACDVEDLPPNVARSWDRIRQLRLRPLAAALPDDDLPQLVRELLEKLEERRRLILTSCTFAAARRTYDSLAAELGVSRERVRQLETSALQQLPVQPYDPLPPAPLARRIGRTTWRYRTPPRSRRTTVDGPDAVLASPSFQ